MPLEPVILNIARRVCENFLNENRATRRHDLIVEFEVTHPLSQMESSGLLKGNDRRDEYLPSAGTFAVLPEEDELHHQARQAFLAVVPLLRQTFLREGQSSQYQFKSLEAEAQKLEPPLNTKTLELGLYLAQHFAALSSFGLSENKLEMASFSISENIINLKDPKADWQGRAQAARSAVSREPVPIDALRAAAYEDMSQYEEAIEASGGNDFWSFLHPSIVPEAAGRFHSGFYADAVLAALKVITHEIRRRTGLDLDGAQLMTRAFATNQPLLQFDGSGTETARNLQQGYLQIFAGTMMAVRNPKAHGFENIDPTRCIHFLFLASLLAYKLDEATDVLVSAL